MSEAGPLRHAAFDLDGTLVGGHGRVHDQLPRRLAELAGRGVRLILVTGRSYESFVHLGLDKEFLAGFGRTVLLSDGDVSWEPATGIVSADRTLPAASVTALRAAGIRDIVVDLGIRHVAFSRRAAMTFAALHGLPRTAVAVVDEAPTHRVTRLTAYAPGLRVSAALASIPCRIDVFTSIEGCAIRPTSSCKTAGLAALLARDGQGLSTTVAFGDGRNDVCLLRSCAMGVAVSGSHPEAALSATTILSCKLSEFLGGFDPVTAGPRRSATACSPQAHG